MDLRNPPVRRIPRELWSMVDSIVKQGLDQPNLWRETVSDTLMIKARDLIDRGNDLSGLEYEMR